MALQHHVFRRQEHTRLSLDFDAQFRHCVANAASNVSALLALAHLGAELIELEGGFVRKSGMLKGYQLGGEWYRRGFLSEHYLLRQAPPTGHWGPR